MKAHTAQLPAWAAPLFRPSRYKVVYGGRGSGKTWAVAAVLVLLSAQRPMRIACLREIQHSIAESSKKVIEGTISRLQLDDYFDIQKQAIYARNGSTFLFRGMSDITARNVYGLEDVDLCWFEEAQSLSWESREILFPTIRKPGSELIFTFNPKNRSDAIWQTFCTDNPRRDEALIVEVNFDQNPWFPDELERERQLCLQTEPERYAHTWLGQPDDAGQVRKVLPYELLQTCVDAWDKRGRLMGRMHAGLDVADAEEAVTSNRCALAARKGPALTYLESWYGGHNLHATARRADQYCREHGVGRLYYDAGGMGAGIRSHLRQFGRRAYGARPVNFGGQVEGPDRHISHDVSNRDFFARRNGQLAWALRLRAQRTARLMDGEPIPPEQCLFIDPSLPGLADVLTELGQPEWKENTSGRVVIDKMPDGSMSPDRFDAVCLSFAADSDDGLSNN